MNKRILGGLAVAAVLAGGLATTSGMAHAIVQDEGPAACYEQVPYTVYQYSKTTTTPAVEPGSIAAARTQRSVTVGRGDVAASPSHRILLAESAEAALIQSTTDRRPNELSASCHRGVHRRVARVCAGLAPHQSALTRTRFLYFLLQSDGLPHSQTM